MIATILLTIVIVGLLVRAVTYIRRRGMCAICDVRGCPVKSLKPARRRSLLVRLVKPTRQPPCGIAPSPRAPTFQSDVTAEVDLAADGDLAADFDLRTLIRDPQPSHINAAAGTVAPRLPVAHPRRRLVRPARPPYAGANETDRR